MFTSWPHVCRRLWLSISASCCSTNNQSAFTKFLQVNIFHSIKAANSFWKMSSNVFAFDIRKGFFLMSFPTTFVAFRPKHVIRCIWMLLPSFGGSIRHAASRIRAENLSLSVVIYHLIPRQGSTLLFCTRRLHFKLSFLVCVWKTFTWIVTVNQGIVSPS